MMLLQSTDAKNLNNKEGPRCWGMWISLKGEIEWTLCLERIRGLDNGVSAKVKMLDQVRGGLRKRTPFLTLKKKSTEFLNEIVFIGTTIFLQQLPYYILLLQICWTELIGEQAYIIQHTLQIIKQKLLKISFGVRQARDHLRIAREFH